MTGEPGVTGATGEPGVVGVRGLPGVVGEIRHRVPGHDIGYGLLTGTGFTGSRCDRYSSECTGRLTGDC